MVARLAHPLLSNRHVTARTSTFVLSALAWALGSTPALADDCDPGATSASGDAHMILAQLSQARPSTAKAKPSPSQPATSVEPESHRPANGTMQRVYDKNQARVDAVDPDLSRQQKRDLDTFYANWVANKARYERVADATGIPAELIAALHWRESTGNFSTYLHQGDPLGKPAVHVPKDIPLFTTWEPAAEHALDSKSYITDKLSLTKDTTDLAALATFAEYYNGLGYYNKGKPSPYVWSGTDQYSRGKYVADGRYSSVTKDRQLGVVAMIQHIRANDAP